MSRDRSQARRAGTGLVGTVLIVLVIAGALRYDAITSLFGAPVRYAEFAEAGGLREGDDVVVSGATVGEVRSIELDGDRVRVGYVLEGGEDLRLGGSTGAAIATVTLLGQAALEIRPAGEGELGDEVIPVERTSSPYDVTSALADLTTRVDAIDTAQLSAALGEVATTFEDTPADVRATLDGLGSLSEALSSNDATLRSVLDRAEGVSGVLAARDAELTTLLTSGESLLAQLVDRRQVVTDLLEGAQELAAQLVGLVDDNDATLGPALQQLQQVVGLLNDQRDDLQAALSGARDYAIGFGEAVSSGPFFDAYIQNLTSPGTLAPVLSGLLDEGVAPAPGSAPGEETP